MREITITQIDEDRRLDRFLAAKLPALTAGAIQKSIRTKAVRVNGKGAQRDTHLHAGDILTLHLPDTCFEIPKKEDPLLRNFPVRLEIIYEDDNILVVNKRPGIMVHPDAQEKVQTLLTHVRAYLYQKGTYDSMDPAAFSPAPCNRIDRFTGGIVLFAKTAEALRVLDQKLRDHEIIKCYLALCIGTPKPPEGLIDNYLFKPDDRKKTEVLHHPAPGAKRSLTRYAVIASGGGLSLIHVELLTGRTHQIRAHMADLGYPLLGDNQYGSKAANRRFGRENQVLYAYRLAFDFTTDAGDLAYLNGREFSVSPGSIRVFSEYGFRLE